MIDKLLANVWMIAAGAAALAAGGLLVALLYLRAAHATLEGELKLALRDLEIQRATIAGYQESVASCNRSIQTLETLGAQKAAQAAQQLARAQQEISRRVDRVRRLEAILVAPTPSGADAGQAVTRIRGELKP